MKYRYREPHELKESGIEWIGKIPKEWEVKKLKYLVDIGNQKESYENNMRYVGLENIESWNGKYVETENQNIEGVSVLFKKGAVLFGKLRPYLAKCLIADFDGCGTSELLVLNCNAAITNKHLKNIMLSQNFVEIVNSSTYGTKMPRASWDFIGELKIPFPKISLQEKTASFLDKKCAEFDGIIEKKERIISKLEEAKKSLISEVVTGKVKIENGKILPRKELEMKESGIEWIGKIPKEWEVKKLKYVSELNARKLSENEYPDFEINYVDIGNVNSNGKIEEIQFFRFENAPSRARRIIKNGDTIVSTVRTYLKAIAYFEKAEDNLICSTGFAVFSPHPDKFAKKYFYYLISSDKYINEIVRNSVGVSYPAINASQIADFNCFLPKIEQQILIASFLDKKTAEIDIVIAKIRDQIEKIKKAKQSLISEAVTGKIEVMEEK